MARIWDTGGGGAAPSHTPLLPGGLRPPDTPKGAPRPWPQWLFAFSRPSHLSRAAALPGAEPFLRNPTFFLNKPLVWSSCAAWGRTFFSEIQLFFEQATYPGQLRCLGQNVFQNFYILVEEATCLGQLRCLGQTFYKKITLFGEKTLVPSSFAAWGSFFPRNRFFRKKPLVLGGWQIFLHNSILSGVSHLSGAASLPGAELVLGNQTFLNKPLSRQLLCWGQNFFSDIRLFF